MKIWGDIPKIFGVYDRDKNVNKVSKTSGTSAKKDIVSISSQAKDFQTAMKALKDIPDIRMEKIEVLAQKYQSGSYDVNGKDIAEKIINSVLDKRV